MWQHVAFLCIHPLTAHANVQLGRHFFLRGLILLFFDILKHFVTRFSDLSNFTSDVLLDFGLEIFPNICRFYPC